MSCCFVLWFSSRLLWKKRRTGSPHCWYQRGDLRAFRTPHTNITDELLNSSRKQPSAKRIILFYFFLSCCLLRLSVCLYLRSWPVVPNGPFCSPFKFCSELMRDFGASLSAVDFYGGAIRMSGSFISQSIRSLPFVQRAQAHIAFHDLLCQRNTQTNRWEP